MSNLRQIPLTGINGASPLGFLAALGAFQTAQQIINERKAKAEAELQALGAIRTAQQIINVPIRLSWSAAGGSWQPVLHVPHETTRESLVEGLDTYLRAQANSPAFTVAKNIKMPAKSFRSYAQSALKQWLSGENPAWAAFAAAFSSDGVADENGEVEDTAFRTMSGAGHQHFLQFMNELVRTTTAAQIKEALFGPWSYSDTQFSMRWDPEDDRRYSLRWSNPSTDPAKNVRGANRLALEGLPFFPTMPNTSRLDTTGFAGKNSSDTFFIWPIWITPVTIEVCQSLLAAPALVNPNTELAHLVHLGVIAVFRSQRVTIGKFRNFTPAVPVGS